MNLGRPKRLVAGAAALVAAALVAAGCSQFEQRAPRCLGQGDERRDGELR